MSIVLIYINEVGASRLSSPFSLDFDQMLEACVCIVGKESSADVMVLSMCAH